MKTTASGLNLNSKSLNLGSMAKMKIIFWVFLYVVLYSQGIYT